VGHAGSDSIGHREAWRCLQTARHSKLQRARKIDERIRPQGKQIASGPCPNWTPSKQRENASRAGRGERERKHSRVERRSTPSQGPSLHGCIGR